MKNCVKCNQTKDLVEFYKQKAAKDGLRPWCKSCVYSYNKNRYENNREFIAAQQAEYYIDNKDHISARRKQWDVDNPGRSVAKCRKRYAAKLQRTPAWLTKEDHEKMEDFYIMARYMEIATGIPHQVDHIIPLQGKNVCGLHVPTNLQVITAEENRKKSNKVLL